MTMMWRRFFVLPMMMASLVGGRILEEERTRTDLILLVPFDVQLAMTAGASDGVNVYALRDIVTDWMNDSFDVKSSSQYEVSKDITFDSVALETASRRRQLQDGEVPDYSLLTVSFEGVSVWNRVGNEDPVNPDHVELIQRATFLEDNQLLNSLKSAEDYTGLGAKVLDVRAFITPTGSGGGSTGSNNLEMIIIIAIVVACLAFGLLMFAVIWAWRTDQSKRDAYKVEHRSLQGPERTRSESDYAGSPEKQPEPQYQAQQVQVEAYPAQQSYHHRHLPQQQEIEETASRPPSEIQPDAYPESVISDDINTSLTAYYQNGMGYKEAKKRDGNDAASMSSMDSYGYSLDGYAPSLSGGPTKMGYPASLNGGSATGGTVNSQVTDSNSANP